MVNVPHATNEYDGQTSRISKINRLREEFVNIDAHRLKYGLSQSTHISKRYILKGQVTFLKLCLLVHTQYWETCQKRYNGSCSIF